MQRLAAIGVTSHLSVVQAVNEGLIKNPSLSVENPSRSEGLDLEGLLAEATPEE